MTLGGAVRVEGGWLATWGGGWEVEVGAWVGVRVVVVGEMGGGIVLVGKGEEGVSLFGIAEVTVGDLAGLAGHAGPFGG